VVKKSELSYLWFLWDACVTKTTSRVEGDAVLVGVVEVTERGPRGEPPSQWIDAESAEAIGPVFGIVAPTVGEERVADHGGTGRCRVQRERLEDFPSLRFEIVLGFSGESGFFGGNNQQATRTQVQVTADCCAR